MTGAGYTLGCDVSFYQDKNETPRGIDFKQMRAAGAEFVYIRAGQGFGRDEDFSRNMAGAKDAGLLRGAYFLFDYRKVAGAQIRLCTDLLAKDRGELPVWLDVERVPSWGVEALRSVILPGVKDFLEALAELGGPLPCIYSNPDMLINCLAPVPEWLLGYPLAVAHYRVERPATSAWVDWQFWQFTDKGDGGKFGVESRQVDLDYFNGSVEDLRTLALQGSAQPVGVEDWARALDAWIRTQGYKGPRLA